MPKTPARKKTRQQKKRVLGEDDGTALACKQSTSSHSVVLDVPANVNGNPVKREKLSTEENELRESLGGGGGRPRRQASNVSEEKPICL